MDAPTHLLKPIDLSVLSHLHDASHEELRDICFLENKLLPALGMNDDIPSQYPPELRDFLGYGLFFWQYPIQFSHYLKVLSYFPITSYFEIGCKHGGTFILTVEYLKKFGTVKAAFAVDSLDWSGLEGYLKKNKTCQFIQCNSQTQSFAAMIHSHPGYDLVLIDGDHSERGVHSDFELMKYKANILAFHDIDSVSCEGVCNFWRFLKKNYSEEYVLLEFCNQYPSLNDASFMGIGLAIRKEYLLQHKKALLALSQEGYI